MNEEMINSISRFIEDLKAEKKTLKRVNFNFDEDLGVSIREEYRDSPKEAKK
jgi:hypothetical protein